MAFTLTLLMRLSTMKADGQMANRLTAEKANRLQDRETMRLQDR